MAKKAEIEKSLIEQLEAQGKTSKFYTDLVADYMYYWGLKRKLKIDINKNGIRYQTLNGNGILVDKANESIVNLQKTTATMLKILADLKLKEPDPVPEDPNAGYL